MILSVARPFVLLAAFAGMTAGQSVISTLAGTDWVFPSSSIKATSAPLGGILGTALDASGRLIGGDCDNHLLFQVDPSGNLTIVAGNGIAGFTPDGPAAGSRLNCPASVTVSPTGELIFADSGRIRKITPAGQLITLAGGGAPAINPVILTLSPDGAVYFSDALTHQVRSIGADGTLRTIAGTGTAGYSGDGGPAISAQLNAPGGLLFTPDGTLLVADSANFRIRAISPSGDIRTIAGIGREGISGMGGPALSAGIGRPYLFVLEPAGTVIFSDAFGNIRRLTANGNVTTVATGFSWIRSLVNDPAGNLYIGDWGRNLIRKRDAAGQVTTFAGNGDWRRTPDTANPATAWLETPRWVGFSPDGLLTIVDSYEGGTVRQVGADGQLRRLGGSQIATGDINIALNRYLRSATQLAFDAAGNMYLAASPQAFKIAPDGRVTVIAGDGPAEGFSGDGGPGTKAGINYPEGIAVSPAGEVFLADTRNHRIRKIGTDGIIRTIAGTGTPGYGGDGGPALAAQLNNPMYLLLDAAGNLYFSDTTNCRVRRIAPDGNIATVAGNGRPAFGGDNGPATAAALSYPRGLTFDAAGNLYIADEGNQRIRLVSPNGVISTIAGNGRAAYAGDGGAPLSASLSRPYAVAVDGNGRIYIADLQNDRIRVISPSGGTFDVTPAAATFSAAGATTPLPAEIRLNSSVAGIAFTARAATTSGGNWLSANPPSGTLPSTLRLEVNTAGLAPGQYTGTVTVSAPLASPGTRQIPVTLTITAAQPPKLSIGSQSLAFNFQQGASPSSIVLSLSNQGSGVVNYNAAAGDWLTVAPPSGQISAGAAANLTVTATPGIRGEGTYSNTLTISDGAATTRIPVTMSIARPQGKLLISQSGLTFTAVEGGGAPASQSFGILNEGSGELPYQTRAATLSGGEWLTLISPEGRVNRPLQDIGFVEVLADSRNLTAGDYYGQIHVTAPGINSPQLVTVLLKVLPKGSNPGPEIRPTGLIFVGTPGSTPPSEDVRVANLLPRATSYASSSLTFDGAGWISHLPVSATVNPNEPRRIVVQPDFKGVSPGVKRGVLTMVFDDGTIRTVSILSVVPATAPAQSKNGERAAISCGSQTLRSEFLSLPEGGAITVGQPVSIEVKVVDDCGNLLLGNEKNANSAVYAKFSSGDPDLRLVPTGNGVWSGTWRPVNVGGGNVTVSAVSVFVQGLTLQAGRSDRGVRVGAGVNAPIVRQGSLVHGASQKGDVPVAPGTLVTLYGSDLAGPAQATSVPLPTDVGGTQVLLGGQPLPILYSSPTQINAQIPFTLAANTAHQVVVRRGGTLSVPETFTVAPAQPGIFTANQQGTGQGIVMGPDQVTVASPATPAKRGQAIIIYCTGLGAVTPEVPLGVPAPSAVLSRTVAPVTVEIGGKAASVFFSGLTPGFTGLYQVNALVPADTPTGDAVNLNIAINGQMSNTVTIAVQ